MRMRSTFQIVHSIRLGKALAFELLLTPLLIDPVHRCIVLTSLVLLEHRFRELDAKVLQSVGDGRALGIGDDRWRQRLTFQFHSLARPIPAVPYRSSS